MNKKTLAIALGLLLLTAGAQAQDGSYGPPPPGGGFGGPPPGGGFGGPPPDGGRFGGPPSASAASVPADALSTGLGLSSDQAAKVAQIQSTFRKARQALRPAPGSGGPPDPQTMQGAMTKVKALDAQASADIIALLTPAQKKALPAFLAQMDTLRQVGIPAELMGSLKLTDAQTSKLSDVAKTAQSAGRDGRRQAHEQALAILTDDQKAQVTKWQEAHPRPERGGPSPMGQGGPPPGGGPDGPPPGGGSDGPPPPGM